MTIAAAGVLITLVVAGGAGAASAGGCAIKGSASFNPGLKTAQGSVSYVFSGSLTNCNGTNRTLKSATVNASGSGSNLSCSGGQSNGSGTLRWNNGQTSNITFKTLGAGSLVKVTGSVTSGPYAGTALNAVLSFVANPVQCNSASGLRSATFNGAGSV